jgi:hypothetical protein
LFKIYIGGIVMPKLKKQVIIKALILGLLLVNSSGYAALPVTEGLELWLDASQTESITAADGSLADGQRISAWNDILLGDNTSSDDAVQTDSTRQPVWIESQPWANNNSVVRFNGSGTWLNAGSLYIGENTTVFIVSQAAIQTNNAASWHRPIIAADSNDPFDIDTGDGYGISYSRDGISSVVASLADTGYGMDRVQTNDVAQDFSFNIIAFRRNADFTNGSQLYMLKSGDPSLVLKAEAQFYKTYDLHTGYDIGANPEEHDGHSVRFYSGDIAEIIVYNTTLSDQDMNAVADYLNQRYIVPGVCGRPEIEYLETDLNKDCYVGIEDVAIFAESWLNCTDQDDPMCDEFYVPEQIAQQRWISWLQRQDSFPLAAWAYFARYDGSFEEYQLYADAGLTMVQDPIYHYEAASAAGLKSLIGSWQALQTTERKSKLEYYVNFPSPYDDSVIGYMLQDEPRTLAEFDLLAAATDYIYKNDKRAAIPIVNLLPGYGSFSGFDDFTDYVSTYVNVVKPAVISYDHYPILADGSDRPGFYSDMEIVRSAALDAEIGFMGFSLVNDHYNYRLPSESDLNWMTWSLLTYGGKGVFYYNWRIEPVDDFGEGMVTHADATPTSVYPMVQSLNSEIQNLADILLKLETVGIYHTSDSLPQGTTAYTNGSVGGVSDLSATEFAVGEFENIADPADSDVYLMLLNKRHGASLTSAESAAAAVLDVDAAYPYVYRYNPASGNLQELAGSGGSYTVELGGGKAVLLRLSADSEL